MDQGVLRRIVTRWIDEPLRAVGFDRASRSRWIRPQSDDLVAMVEQFTERRGGVARFTFEWGFFSVRLSTSFGPTAIT